MNWEMFFGGVAIALCLIGVNVIITLLIVESRKEES